MQNLFFIIFIGFCNVRFLLAHKLLHNFVIQIQIKKTVYPVSVMKTTQVQCSHFETSLFHHQTCNTFSFSVIMGGTETLMNRMGAFRNLSCSLSTVNYSEFFFFFLGGNVRVHYEFLKTENIFITYLQHSFYHSCMLRVTAPVKEWVMHTVICFNGRFHTCKLPVTVCLKGYLGCV